MTEARTLPPRLPVQEPGDYAWRARDWVADAHAFPPVEAGRLPGAAPCGIRWNALFGYEGGGHCATCVAFLRDQLRATVTALAAAGISVDRAAPVDDQRGDHFAGMPD